MGRLTDFLLYGPAVTRPPAVPDRVTAAAGRVTVAGPARHANVPFGFGPPLEPFVFPDTGMLDRTAAMQLPTIGRARNLIVSAVSALPFTFWQVNTNTVPSVERRIPAPGWHDRPDPAYTRQWLLGWTADDLLFDGCAYWLVTDRYRSTGFPSTFSRIIPGNLEVRADGTVIVTDDDGRRAPVDPRDVVEFHSPQPGLLAFGARAISIAWQLDEAADRFAATDVPAGWLEEQEGAEDMSADDLDALAQRFTYARSMNTIAAVNKYVRYREASHDPSAMQIVDGRQYQALELARLANVPAYLVGAPAGTGMTYQNALQAKSDLIDFGAAPIIGCIEQTLSGPKVTPRGQVVRLDQNAWLRNPFTTAAVAEPSPNDLQVADPATPPPAPVLEVPQ